MEWPACLDEYEKLVYRMNTPRFVSYHLPPHLHIFWAFALPDSFYFSSSSVSYFT